MYGRGPASKTINRAAVTPSVTITLRTSGDRNMLPPISGPRGRKMAGETRLHPVFAAAVVSGP